MELTYICKICGFEAKNHTSLTSHLQYKHKDYNTQKYYDEFYKKENEGKCEVCGKPSIFKNMVQGYLPCCSKSCSHKTKKFLNSFRKAINEKTEKELKEWRNKGLKTKKSKSSNGKCITAEELKHKEEKTLKHYQSWFPYITEYHNNVVKGICPDCHREFTTTRWLVSNRHKCNMTCCVLCNPVNFNRDSSTSNLEKEITNYIKDNYNFEFVRNNRTELEGYELDIWIPKYRIAIEVDGTYWHADPRVFKSTDIIKQTGERAEQIWKRDKMKDGFAKRKQIHLIRIKEYDWKNNKDLTIKVLNEKLENLVV